MRLVSIVLLGAFLLPLSIADGGPRHDETLALGDGTSGTLYVSACRISSVGQDPVVDLVADCVTSGVYQESNGFSGAQVESGVYDGVAYSADSGVLTL